MKEFKVVYAYGRGGMTADLDELMPCTAADCKRLVSCLEQTAEPWTYAEQIRDHIAEKVAELQAEREKCDDSQRGKAATTRINATLKKYLANAAELVKRYDLQPITDAAAQVKMAAGAVYAMTSDGIKEHNGWTFEKAGFVFEVYKADKAYYRILLAETGKEVANCSNKSAAPAEITERVAGILKNGAAKIEQCKAEFRKAMTAAGYMAEQAPETAGQARETTEQTETPAQAPETVYTADTITRAGETVPAGYSITPRGAVVVFVAGDRIRIEKGDADYDKARSAAEESRKRSVMAADQDAAQEPGTALAIVQEPAPEEPETAPETPETDAPEQDTTQEPEQAETAEQEPAPEQDRRTVPEKTFIGSTITGRGWRILFDAEAERTRVIFAKCPPVAYRNAVKAAGFYWSPLHKSWNKKLTWKAYRAAGRLAEELQKLDKAS